MKSLLVNFQEAKAAKTDSHTTGYVQWQTLPWLSIVETSLWGFDLVPWAVTLCVTVLLSINSTVFHLWLEGSAFVGRFASLL